MIKIPNACKTSCLSVNTVCARKAHQGIEGTVKPTVNVPQLKVFPYLMFSFSRRKSVLNFLYL
jgi:hypothetical protein